MLTKKLRRRIREIARKNYVNQSGERRHILLRSLSDTDREIRKEFGSGIITSLLIGLMIKLATKYIEQWIEEKLFSYHVPEQFEEVK